MLERWMRTISIAALAATALYVLWFTYQFGQTRFFTIDEYQFGHATWMVAQGQLPYVDFYEHHFPLGYLLHGFFFPDDASFIERALLMRKITFFYLLLTMLLLGWVSFSATKNAFAGLLSVALPLSFGFGLMSAIDYRADVWAACLFIACLALLEHNRGRESWPLAALAGVLFAGSILMTQKMVIFAGGSIGLMLIPNILERLGLIQVEPGRRLITCPGTFVSSATAIGGVVLLASIATGTLPEMFEITFVQAIEHEQIYKPFSAWKYFPRFLEVTGLSTLAIVLAAIILFLSTAFRSFWLIPFVVVLIGGFLIRAPYPYNFVCLSFLLCICAVRGYTSIIDLAWPDGPSWRAVRPLLFLLPVAAIFQQLAFVAGTTTNAHQLNLLEKIEQHTTPDDTVIDDAGGALFRPDRGYYWYHSIAHVRLPGDYFSKQVIEDMRASRAPFWIYDMRFNILPPPARRYLVEHYIHVDSSLFGLGFRIQGASGQAEHKTKIDVIRAGEYWVSLDTRWSGTRYVRGREAPWQEDLLLDGKPIESNPFFLEEGVYEVTALPRSPGYKISYFPAAVFGEVGGGLPHAMLFEYESEVLTENVHAVPYFLRRFQPAQKP